jgi:phenylacetate-coenzyme A ligase PaaK-like adenylate-forming protein
VWLATNLLASPAGKAGRILILPVTLQPAEMVRELNAFQPTTLTGYASALGLLAEAQQAGRLNIAPRMVVNTAEALRTEDRRTIQSVFGCQVRDIYSSAEVGVITYECRYGARHINADSIIVETVDEQYQPLPPGQAAGNVLVTSLTKRVMPIIRYELRDQVTILPGQCRCGLHLPMITFQGRTDHTLTFQTCEGKSIKVLPLALYAAIKKSPYAMTAQVVQTGPACLKIRLTPGPGQDSETTWNQVVDSVRQFLDSQDLQCVELIRAVEPPQRDPRSNKLHEAIVDFK